jgi:hypothetical protein
MKSAAKLVRVSEELAEEHKRRNALATLCKLREALRLLYFGALSEDKSSDTLLTANSGDIKDCQFIQSLVYLQALLPLLNRIITSDLSTKNHVALTMPL